MAQSEYLLMKDLTIHQRVNANTTRAIFSGLNCIERRFYLRHTYSDEWVDKITSTPFKIGRYK